MKCACSHCSDHLEYDDELGGRDVECPHCGQITTLVAPGVANPQLAAHSSPSSPSRAIPGERRQGARAYFPPIWIPTLWQVRAMGMLGGAMMLVGLAVIGFCWSERVDVAAGIELSSSSGVDRQLRVISAIGLIICGGVLAIGGWLTRLMHVVRSKRF